MKKRLLSLLIVFTLVLAMLMTACTKEPAKTEEPMEKPAEKTTAPEEKTETDESTTLLEKRIEPTFMFRSNLSQLNADSLGFQYIGEMTNVYLQPMPIPVANFKDKLNTVLASNVMPDLISMRGGKPIVMEYGPQGAFVSYTPYVEAGEMPNFKKAMDEVSDDSWKILTATDGQVYGAPRIYTYDMLHESFMVRTDLMKKWDFGDRFENPDELTDFLRKAKEEYPDSFPAGNRWGGNTIIRGMAHQYWTDIKMTFDFDTDQYIYGPLKEGFVDFMSYLNTWYTEGLLDPNWQNTSDEEWEENILNENAFFVYDYMTEGDRLTTEGAKTIDGFEFMGVVPFSGDPNHEVGMAECYHRLYELLKVIPESSKHKEDLVKFVDWCYSEDGVNTVLYGKEGVQFTKDADGSIVLADDIKTVHNPDGSFVPSENAIAHEFTAMETEEYAFAYGGGPYQIAAWTAHKDAGAVMQAQPKPNYTDEQLDRKSQLEASINTYMDELMVNFITGKVSLDTWETHVEKLKELGVEELVEIYNAAYDATYR